jgi:hypothetical protein
MYKMILWHVDPLLGNDREATTTTAAAKTLALLLAEMKAETRKNRA